MVNQQVDILIVGGGLTGATLLLALKDLGYRVLLIESKPFSDKINPDFDARSLALSPATMRILNTLGIWQLLQPFTTPIHFIHVSDQHRFGVSRLEGSQKEPLGYVVEMQYIQRVLHQSLTQNQLLAPASLIDLDVNKGLATISTVEGTRHIEAQLIVAADGAESMVRKCCQLPIKSKFYHQQGIVANIGLVKPHLNRAYERFTSEGPLALLPMQDNKMAMVWALPPKEAQTKLALSDKEFLSELQHAFGYRLGRFDKVGTRHAFPLKQIIMPKQAQWPVVFIGNAAHTLHPVAGQGFNLGLRDVATLAQCIAAEGLTPTMVQNYLKLRQHDQQAITYFTDGLIKVFTSKLPGIGIARSIGLTALDNIPALKSLLARYARGFGGFVPDLVCEIALTGRKIT